MKPTEGITAIILAGGQGTRLRELTQDRWPKPMIPVAVEDESFPFLEFVLAHLSQQGISDFVFCVGHLGHQISEHFGDGSEFGCRFRYDDAGDVDTGSRVLSAMGLVSGKDVLVTCGDVFFPLDVGRFHSRFAVHPDWQVMLAAVQTDGPSEANVAFDPRGLVTAHGKIDYASGKYGLEAGTLLVRYSAFEAIDTSCSFSLTKDLFPELIRQRTLGCSIEESVFFDIGTPAGYRRFQDFAAGGEAQPLSRSSESGRENGR